MLLALRSLWEPSVTPPPVPGLPPTGPQIFQGFYPYWGGVPRKRRPIKEEQEVEEFAEEEELIALLSIDL